MLCTAQEALQWGDAVGATRAGLSIELNRSIVRVSLENSTDVRTVSKRVWLIAIRPGARLGEGRLVSVPSQFSPAPRETGTVELRLDELKAHGEFDPPPPLLKLIVQGYRVRAVIELENRTLQSGDFELARR